MFYQDSVLQTLLSDAETQYANMDDLNQQFNDTYERKLYKVYYYAHLHFDEDTTNTKYQKLKGKVDQLLQKVGDITSYIPEELMSTYNYYNYEIIKEDNNYQLLSLKEF